MPIYEYKCKKCGEHFEELRYSRDSDKARDCEIRCPKCGTYDPERLFSVFGDISEPAACGSDSYGPVHA